MFDKRLKPVEPGGQKPYLIWGKGLRHFDPRNVRSASVLLRTPILLYDVQSAAKSYLKLAKELIESRTAGRAKEKSRT